MQTCGISMHDPSIVQELRRKKRHGGNDEMSGAKRISAASASSQLSTQSNDSSTTSVSSISSPRTTLDQTLITISRPSEDSPEGSIPRPLDLKSEAVDMKCRRKGLRPLRLSSSSSFFGGPLVSSPIEDNIRPTTSDKNKRRLSGTPCSSDSLAPRFRPCRTLLKPKTVRKSTSAGECKLRRATPADKLLMTLNPL